MYSFDYDKAGGSLDESCGKAERTMGRVQRRIDSGGQTWYSYDAQGRVLAEIRVPTGGVCSGLESSQTSTFYAYDKNGNIRSITYPRGRRVEYVYGSSASGLRDRPSEIKIQLWNGSQWSPLDAVTKINWEPYGDLRGYQLNFSDSANSAGVEYMLGDNAGVAPATNCSTPAPSLSTSDRTGRLRALAVSSGGYAPGTASGDIYKRTYTWNADQVSKIDSCVRGAGFQREEFTYDQLLRLDKASMTAGSTGGAYRDRDYSFNARSNMTGSTADGFSGGFSYSHAGVGDPDRLQSYTANGALRGRAYAYSASGRTTAITHANDSSGDPASRLDLYYASSTHGAIDDVFRAVSVNGATYNYYYDALGRRRKKVYPTGVADEFFYSNDGALIGDQGASTLTAAAPYPIDEYVWLGGRPLILIRSKFDANWARQPDGSGTCDRLGDSGPCGVYFVVTDHIGKPVLMLDSSRRITGLGEYTPFGELNRAEAWGDVPNYADSMPEQPFVFLRQPPRGLKLDMRLGFDVLDTESCGGTYYDPVLIRDNCNQGAVLTGPLGGHHQRSPWTDWIRGADAFDGRLRVTFQSNASNLPPDCATGSQRWAYTGPVLRKYEYRRYEQGTTPVWTPLRFPGQYHDAETDLYENWHRYYDPVTGRYLQPEPMLADPSWVVEQIGSGMSTPVYAYAGNNPVMFTDPTGREIDFKDQAAVRAFIDMIQNGEGLHLVRYLASSPMEYRVYGSATPSENLPEDAAGITGNGPGETGHEGRRIDVNDSGKISVTKEGLDIRLFLDRASAAGISPMQNLAHEMGHAVMWDAARTGRPGYPSYLEPYFRFTGPGQEHYLEAIPHALYTGEMNQRFRRRR